MLYQNAVSGLHVLHVLQANLMALLFPKASGYLYLVYSPKNPPI